MTDTFARMRQIVGTTAEWNANDLIIGLGEIAIESLGPNNMRAKIGDGINRYSALRYIGGDYLPLTGGTLGGPLYVPNPPPTSDDSQAPNTRWVMDHIGAILTGLAFQGTWNASTNIPTLVNGGGSHVRGDYYVVDTAGNTVLDGQGPWSVGDLVVFSGTVWQRVPETTTAASIIAALGYTPADDAEVIKKSIIDSPGDLIVGTAPDTVARLGAGAPGSLLTATVGGVAWQPTLWATGSMTAGGIPPGAMQPAMGIALVDANAGVAVVGNGWSPPAGMWWVNAMFGMQSNASALNNLRAAIGVDGVPAYQALATTYSLSDLVTPNVSGLFALNGSQALTFHVQCSAAASVVGPNIHSIWQAYRIGPQP